MENIQTPDLQAIINRFSPFLYEVKRRIIVTVIFFCATTVFGFFFYEQIIRVLIRMLSLSEVNVVFTSPFQFINLAISCGAASGIILSFPVVLYQIMSFLRPALRKKEYNLIVRLIPFSLFLFVFGFIFGAMVMKWQIDIFLARSVSLGIGNVLDISRLLTTIVWTAALMGLLFEFPIVLLLLLRLGIIKRHHLGKYRFYIYVLSFIIAIFLPPDSILADVLLSLPLIVLFEITLLIDRASRRG